MKCTFDILAQKIVNFCIALYLFAGLYFCTAIGSKCFLAKDFPRKPYAMAEVRPIIFMRHIVKQNAWFIARIGGTQRHAPTRFGTHRTHMRLKSMRFCCSLAIIAD